MPYTLYSINLLVSLLSFQIKSMDVHIEALAYSGDTAWELSNSLEARVDQVMLPNCRLEMTRPTVVLFGDFLFQSEDVLHKICN